MTDKNEDGGPAFPQESKWHTLEDQKLIIAPHVGLSIRDYFAAAALTGLLDDESNPKDAEMFAVDAYAIADAMLAARKAKP